MGKAYINIHQKEITACMRGDRRAQFAIYKQYAGAMYNVSLRMLGSQAHAEDAMQEAFIKAFQKINTYKGEVSFGAWLKRIVVNTALDHIKAKRMHFEEIEDGNIPEEDDEPFFDDATHEEMITRIKACLQHMPQGYRVILSLVLFEGYDHEEVAEILNISASTSRSQFARAKKKLQEQLR